MNTENTNDIDIFICTHKDFAPIVSNSAYKIITTEGTNITNTNGLDVVYEKKFDGSFDMRDSYSECSRHWYVVNNIPLKKYVGFCHYRRYPTFLNNINIALSLLKTYDVLALNKYDLYASVFSHFEKFHHIDDLIECVDILCDIDHECKSLSDYFLHEQQWFYSWTSFFMKSIDYI